MASENRSDPEGAGECPHCGGPDDHRYDTGRAACVDQVANGRYADRALCDAFTDGYALGWQTGDHGHGYARGKDKAHFEVRAMTADHPWLICRLRTLQDRAGGGVADHGRGVPDTAPPAGRTRAGLR